VKRTGKYTTILLSSLIVALVYSLAAPTCTEAFGRGIHQDIAMYAKMLANGNLFVDADHPDTTDPTWMQEINNYLPDVGAGDPDTYDLTAGASHEDEWDHVWNHSGLCVTISHFWNADLGPDSTMNTVNCNLWDPNAWQKARQLWGMALGQYYIGNKHSAYEYLGHIVHLLGDMTVPAHAHFDSHKTDTYDGIYMDGGDDHQTIKNSEGNLPEYLTLSERLKVKELGMVEIPYPTIVPNGTPEGRGLLPLYWLFYTTSQVGGYYPSDDYDGNADDPMRPDSPNQYDAPYMANLLDFSKLDPIPSWIDHNDIDFCNYNDVNDPCRWALDTIRENAYFYSIRAVAALYKLWADTISNHAELVVALDRVRTVEKWGPFDEIQPEAWPFDDPNFFVRVWIGSIAPDHDLDYHGPDDGPHAGGVWFRNEGEQTDGTSEDAGWIPLPLIHGQGTGESGWAFANDVGQHGPAHVEIELWDDDNPIWRGVFYEHWDIYTEDPDNSEWNIWLDIPELDACRAGTPGSIGGDLPMTCGIEGSSAGDDAPIGDIAFRIFMAESGSVPNAGVVANAGADQTVNEGDEVTLNGSFTDPDPNHTWTYEWHLVHSPGKQTIFDYTGSSTPNIPVPFKFTPCDNGDYIFSFAVTAFDNGTKVTQGSDTVKVRVLNVQPVVSVPYISKQPNGEFILPVVHSIEFKGMFTDIGTCDTHTALWDWGDGGTSNGVVTELNGAGSVTGYHILHQAGNFTVTLVVTDDDGGHNSNTMTVHIADVQEALNIFNAYIQALPNNKFKNNANQRKNAYNNQFLQLKSMLAQKDYKGMISTMKNSLRSSFDGQLGGSTKDDWIIENLSIQKELCQKADDITSYLQYLLSTSH
jgi:hypothetical protein